MNDTPNGIAGLVGREPIGAALTAGIKGANGAPTEKDRFHILDSTANSREYQKRDGGTYKAPARDLHPSFGQFNAAAAERRRVIPAVLAHATIPELFEYRRQAQTLPGHVHPAKAPSCIGDGVRATRWHEKDEAYFDLPCPGEQCPYAQPGPNDRSGRPTKSACGPWMRFIARFNFPQTTDGKGFPSIPFKLTSGGWNSIKNFVGFFDSFRNACAGFGVDPNRVPLFGLPVVITLQEKTNPATQSRFPVVSIQVAGNADLIGWIGLQLTRGAELRQLVANSPLALTDRELSSPEVLDMDARDIAGPALNVPSGK